MYSNEPIKEEYGNDIEHISFWEVQRFIQERQICFHDLMLLKFEIEKRIHQGSGIVMPRRRKEDKTK